LARKLAATFVSPREMAGGIWRNFFSYEYKVYLLSKQVGGLIYAVFSDGPFSVSSFCGCQTISQLVELSSGERQWGTCYNLQKFA